MQLYFNDVTWDNNIVVNQCYDYDWGAAQPKAVTEFTKLGTFPAGYYSGILFYRSQYDPSDTDCSQYGIRDSLRFSFTVSQPAGLANLSEADLTLSP
ncbi:MAG: hypothetical protein JST83_02615 [Bacteroidetes bacterium]|nr:hypothetical protein [Bacteroidota bacterium]